MNVDVSVLPEIRIALKSCLFKGKQEQGVGAQNWPLIGRLSRSADVNKMLRLQRSARRRMKFIDPILVGGRVNKL